MQKIRIQSNKSIKPIRITENISVWEKQCWGQALFKGPIWGQTNFWSQAKHSFGANFEAKNWGLANFEDRPGQVL